MLALNNTTIPILQDWFQDYLQFFILIFTVASILQAIVTFLPPILVKKHEEMWLSYYPPTAFNLILVSSTFFWVVLIITAFLVILLLVNQNPNLEFLLKVNKVCTFIWILIVFALVYAMLDFLYYLYHLKKVI